MIRHIKDLKQNTNTVYTGKIVISLNVWKRIYIFPDFRPFQFLSVFERANQTAHLTIHIVASFIFTQALVRQHVPIAHWRLKFFPSLFTSSQAEDNSTQYDKNCEKYNDSINKYDFNNNNMTKWTQLLHEYFNFDNLTFRFTTFYVVHKKCIVFFCFI